MPPAKTSARPAKEFLCWDGNVQKEADLLKCIYDQLKCNPETAETQATVKRWYRLIMGTIKEKAQMGYCVKLPFGKFELGFTSRDSKDVVRVAFKAGSSFKNIPPSIIKEVQARTGTKPPPKRASSGLSFIDFMAKEKLTAAQAKPLYKAWRVCEMAKRSKTGSPKKAKTGSPKKAKTGSPKKAKAGSPKAKTGSPKSKSGSLKSKKAKAGSPKSKSGSPKSKKAKAGSPNKVKVECDSAKDKIKAAKSKAKAAKDKAAEKAKKAKAKAKGC